jgi:hypothetical protein
MSFSSILKSLLAATFCLIGLAGIAGCGSDAPATPAEIEQQPTSEEPPPGEEPTLPEEGP